MQEEGLLTEAVPEASARPSRVSVCQNLLLLAVFVAGLIASKCAAQGLVYVANHVLIPYAQASGYDVLIRGADGITPIVGTNFVAQIYYGDSPDTLIPNYRPPLRFRTATTTLPGTWMPGHATLPGFPQGSLFVLAVKVWDSNFGTTYEQALANGGFARDYGPFYYRHPNNLDPVASTNYYMFGFRANNSLESCPTNRPPSILSQPVNHEVAAGTSITLAPEVSGACLYRWVRNGTNDAGFRQTLSLTNVQPTDAGSYQLIAGNYAGSVTSEVATVTIVVPPRLESKARTDGQLHFFVPGPGTWVVETATNLSVPVRWLPVHTNPAPFWYTNAITPGDWQRFYRVVFR